MTGKKRIDFPAFEQVDLCLGRVVSAEILEAAHQPTYKLRIEFGSLGERLSTARITQLYTPADLVNRQVVCVVNLPPRRIAGVDSQVLVLGIPVEGGVSLLRPDHEGDPGVRVF